jgi:hypothetical protein
MSKLVHNEGLKLFANWLNSLSVTILAAGVVAPVASVALEITPRSVATDQLAKFALICMCISGALHLSAQLVIMGLSDDE